MGYNKRRLLASYETKIKIAFFYFDNYNTCSKYEKYPLLAIFSKRSNCPNTINTNIKTVQILFMYNQETPICDSIRKPASLGFIYSF
ncbi:hypothetical protein BpHYR1_014440 [Brachionus plicatilis]|uniref:Uncharacterized protein n=1 Tax=Brachionus plicatilis TaxID=10195 RepID=A0A3M7RJQ9_BRAPC|nr:hypothetical protein BpHYR1_014440 [Brachionus plicatilis]